MSEATTETSVPVPVPAPVNMKPALSDSVGMSYLETPSRKFVTIYLPLIGFLVVLLFPFYWMGITSVKPSQKPRPSG